MTLTPRQIAAYLDFGDKLDRFDRINDLMITAVGAQGDDKQIERMRKDLSG